MQVLRLAERQVHEMAWADLERSMQKWNEHMHIGVWACVSGRMNIEAWVSTLQNTYTDI